MPTLQESIETLDRLVNDGADIPKTRSQIAFIGREIAALEADYANLAQTHAKLQEAHTKLEQEHTKLKKAQSDAGWNALRKEADDYQKMIRSHQLNHDI